MGEAGWNALAAINLETVFRNRPPRQKRRGARQQAKSVRSGSQGSFYQHNAANNERLDDGGYDNSVSQQPGRGRGRGRGRGYRGRWQRGNRGRGGRGGRQSPSNAGYQNRDDVSSNYSDDTGSSANVTYGRYLVADSKNNSKNQKPAIASLPDPMKLFNFLLNRDEFRCTVATLCLAGFLAPDVNAKSLSAYLNQNSKLFLSSTSGNFKEWDIQACHRALKLCTKYMRSRSCDEGCAYFHLCQYYVAGCCQRKNCKFSHNNNDSHNSALLKRHGLTSLQLNPYQLMELFQHSIPQICHEYNGKDGCSAKRRLGTNVPCCRLHVCITFHSNTECTCNREHDIKSEYNMKILERYKFQRLEINTLKSIVLRAQNTVAECNVAAASTSRSSDPAMHLKGRSSATDVRANSAPSQEKIVANKTASVQQTQHSSTAVASSNSNATGQVQDNIHGDDRERDICLAYLDGKCSRGQLCGNHHVSSNYCWQVKYKNAWISLSTRDSNSVEHLYQAPSRDIATLKVCYPRILLACFYCLF
jgi:hypothetical protein